MTGQYPKVTETPPRAHFELARLGTGRDLSIAEARDFINEYGRGALKDIRSQVSNIMEMSPEEFRRQATENNFSSKEKARRFRRKLRNGIMDSLGFLGRYKKTEREAGLKEVGRMANDYINGILKDYFPDQENMRMNNEVSTCNDIAALMMMAYNEDLSEKVKFEAGRKVLLMKYLGEIKDYSKKEFDNEEALAVMMGFFNREIIVMPSGARIGETIPRYIVSKHEGEEKITTEARIIDEVEIDMLELEEGERITQIEGRRTFSVYDDEPTREIFFTIEPRAKDINSRLTKTLRYGTAIGEKDVDLNGIRMVFETREDWETFFEQFKTILVKEIEENLRARLEREDDSKQKGIIESRLRSVDRSVIIYEVKDSLGEAKFVGNSDSASQDLKVFKFKMEVMRSDGRIHHYEFQIFLPDGYTDAKYRKGVAWEEFKAARFFEEGIDELLFPERIYGVDREEATEKAVKRAYRKNWNGGAVSKEQLDLFQS